MSTPRLNCRGCLRVIGVGKDSACLTCEGPSALHAKCRDNGVRSEFFEPWCLYLCLPCFRRAILLTNTEPVIARAVGPIVIVESAPTLAHAVWCESYGLQPANPERVTCVWWGKMGATLP